MEEAEEVEAREAEEIRGKGEEGAARRKREAPPAGRDAPERVFFQHFGDGERDFVPTELVQGWTGVRGKAEESARLRRCEKATRLFT